MGSSKSKTMVSNAETLEEFVLEQYKNNAIKNNFAVVLNKHNQSFARVVYKTENCNIVFKKPFSLSGTTELFTSDKDYDNITFKNDNLIKYGRFDVDENSYGGKKDWDIQLENYLYVSIDNSSLLLHWIRTKNLFTIRSWNHLRDVIKILFDYYCPKSRYCRSFTFLLGLVSTK